MRAVLTYHSIDDSGSPVSLDASTFRRHVRWLASGAVRVVSLEELIGLPDTADAVALTFDDGFANFAELAWPLLRERGLPVTLFVATDFIGGANELRSYGRSFPRLPLLEWAGVVQLAEGGAAIGSHTRTHPDLRSLSRLAIIEEVSSAAERIHAEIGSWPTCFSYPYGWYNHEVSEVVAAVHRIACTAEMRILSGRDSAWCIPRLDTYYFRQPGRLEAWGSARFRAYVWLRQQARQLRSALATYGPQQKAAAHP